MEHGASAVDGTHVLTALATERGRQRRTTSAGVTVAVSNSWVSKSKEPAGRLRQRQHRGASRRRNGPVGPAGRFGSAV